MNCGRQYGDETERCLDDNQLLSPGPPPLPAEAFEARFPLLGNALTDRRMRLAEVAFFCLVAFGGSFLASTFHFVTGAEFEGTNSPEYAVFKWTDSSVFEISCLGLLCCLVRLRGRTLFDLGFRWRLSDLPWSILLTIAGRMAFYAAYYVIWYAMLATGIHIGHQESARTLLFAGGISAVTILFQFINPFFEELIVRAYVMTEVNYLTNSIAAAIIFSTVLQTSYHLYQGVPTALSQGAMFLIFSVYYAKKKRICPVILAHLYFDVGSTLWYLIHP